jgi:hypothetical protein
MHCRFLVIGKALYILLGRGCTWIQCLGEEQAPLYIVELHDILCSSLRHACSITEAATAAAAATTRQKAKVKKTLSRTALLSSDSNSYPHKTIL